MAPNFKAKASFKGKNPKRNSGPPSAHNNKKWVPKNKFFEGSLQEGQGFAFKRKLRVQQEYNKLLRKERRRKPDCKPQVTEYPEHLRHLYMAEQERLDKEEHMKRNRRMEGRAAKQDKGEDMAQTSFHSSSDPGGADTLGNASSDELPQSSQVGSSHKGSLRQRKKMSSYQKTKQEYERLKAEREKKREEYLKDKSQREEALKKYKDKKMATYQLLKKKTKKGQPNLNLQMELLLQKIQAQSK
ncbi:hypothetical protein NFI96_017743 [Prochilodus magdalenae]|nr:hypothetical protein NFI96_017743 [Prochilodus magdalenae]